MSFGFVRKWKRAVDSDQMFGALFTDLSKTFDCLDHELLIAKRNAYRFSLPALKLVYDYLSNNLLKSNADKYHSLVSSSDVVSIRLSEYEIKNSECEKLFGVKFDNTLTFEKHITDICRKASRMIHALARIGPYIDLSKRLMVINASFNLQFNYCLLSLICHHRTTNKEAS